MRVILTRGLPSSGKSTWAKQYVRDNPGAIRFNNDEFSYMTTGWPDGRSFEPMDPSYLTLMRNYAIEAAVFRDADLVLDNTNLNPRVGREVEWVANVEYVNFEVPVDECIRRNIIRGEPIPNHIITDMVARYGHLYDWI